MMGVKVVELARELEMTAAELVHILAELGVPASGPSALIEADTAQAVREMYAKKQSGTKKVAEIPAGATVKDLALAMGIQPSDVQKKLMAMGVLVAINQRLSNDAAQKLAGAYGFTVRIKSEARSPVATASTAVRPKHHAAGKQPRPPVVTILGHVDHGKTTLLDAIRHTNVVDGEFGGITQHIGAYQVEVDYEGQKRKVTFLDTPGHAAFTAMRARGTSVTDIAVLVVAADDGIMPQTVEAIDHAKAAGVPIIVAINKIDRPDANIDRVKTQLTEHGLVPSDYGGETECLPISARDKTGIDDLLENILLQADILELRADPSGRATGAIVEAEIETGRGPVATALVQAGTLHIGDSVVCGLVFGKVRAMMNERAERLTKAGPATPVEILGLSAVPQAGDKLEVVKDEKTARQIAQQRAERQRAARLSAARRTTLEDVARRIREGETKELNVVVKADVQGSAEAVVNQLQQLPQDEVRLQVLHTGVGTITESDITLASASDAVVIGFNVRADHQALQAAEREHVEVRTYQIIYELTEAVERTMKGLLAPVFEEVALGKADVRQTFRTPRGVVIAGCYVTEGKLQRNADVRVLRGRDVVFTGRIDSLRHIKDDVREMAQGYECGVVIADYNEVAVGDVLDCYQMRQVER